MGVHLPCLERSFHRSRSALPDFHNRLCDGERRERLRLTVKLYIIISGLLTTSTLPTIFVPFNLADELDRIKIDDPGTPVVTSLKMYSWMRGACALSFACSLLCIVAAFAYIFLLQHKSAADYARFEVERTHDVLVTLWLSHKTMEAPLTLSFAFALAAVCMAAVKILDVAAGTTILVILACIIVIMAYIWAQTFRVAERMRYKAPSIVRRATGLTSKPYSAQAALPAGKRAPAPAPEPEANAERVVPPVAKMV